MNFTRKKFILLTLMGIVVFSAMYIPLCSPLCPTNHHRIDFSQSASCAFSSHSFVQIGIGLSVLFILTFSGFALGSGIPFIPEGFYLALFKPPRSLA
jgi:hypothetical protein